MERIVRLFVREVVQLPYLFPETAIPSLWDCKILDLTQHAQQLHSPGTLQMEADMFTVFCVYGSIRFIRHFVDIKQVVRGALEKLL